MFKKFFTAIIHISFFTILIYGIYYIYTNHFKNSSLLDGQFNSIINSNNITTAESYKGNIANNSTTSNSKNQNIHINISTSNDTSTSNSSYPNYFRYYYNQLDYPARIIYSALEKNIDNLKLENFKINFNKTFNNLLNKTDGEKTLNSSFQSALDAFFYDHPELFYLDMSKMTLITECTTLGKIKTYKVHIAPRNNDNYLRSSFNSESQVDAAITQVNTLKNAIIQNTTGNNYEQILTIHDTLIDLMQYDQTLSRPNTHNIYGALIEKQAVCEGYAKAFKYILDSLDIQCILVSGTATNSSGQTESHMWNYVHLNNNWYGLDLTWDDPIIVGGLTKNIIKHDYFCKGSSKFDISHIAEGNLSDSGMIFNLPTLAINNYKK